MVERNVSVSGHDRFASETAPGMALPLLPTIVVAVVMAAGSFLCREPAPAEPHSSLQVSPLQVHSPQQVSAIVGAAEANASAAPEPVLPFVPAALAFRQFPLVQAPLVAEARRPVPHVASAGPARPAARRPEIARAGVKAPASPVEPAPVEMAADEETIPALALPFAPAIRVIGRAGAFVGMQGAAVGAQASALGDAVVGLVDHLR